MSQDNVIAQDKVIVIVGVGPGLGTAIPRRFAREGFSVGLIARKAANLEAAKAVIEAEGGKVAGAVGAKVAGAVGAKVAIAEGDASDGVSLKKAFDALRGEVGDPSVLVYNAGAFVRAPLMELTEEQLVDSWRIGCLGAFLSAQQVLPDMVAKGRGTILLTGATGSMRGSANFACMAVSKFGLRALGQSMAREFGPQGIHVAHIIVDGQINNPRTRERFGTTDRPEDTFLDTEAMADTYWHLHAQHKTSWAQEIDLRPSMEKF